MKKHSRNEVGDARVLGSMRALMGVDDTVVVVQSTDNRVAVVSSGKNETVNFERCAVGVRGKGAVAEIISWNAGYSSLLNIWFCTHPQRGAVYDDEESSLDGILLIDAEQANALGMGRRAVLESGM